MMILRARSHQFAQRVPLKKIGLYGFWFFLIKGLAWIAAAGVTYWIL